jgi:ferredoxin-thioredoxin reductase catalytic subunit
MDYSEPSETIAVAKYEETWIFPSCEYDLDEVHSYWVRYCELYVILEEGDKPLVYSGVKMENDYKRADHLALDRRIDWV